MTEAPTTEAIEQAIDAADGDKPIDEAMRMIDGALGTLTNRELVSSGEVADVLLDVRAKLREDLNEKLGKDDSPEGERKANSSSPVALG